MSNAEVGGVIPEVVVEKGEISGVVPVPMAVDSPSPVLEISLVDSVAVNASLASIDQAALSLMVILGGALEDQATPSFKGKEVAVATEEVVREQTIAIAELGGEKSAKSAPFEAGVAPEE